MSRRAWIPIGLLLVLLAAAAPFLGAARGDGEGEWRYYNADLASTKYSPLDQINKNNVSTLPITWRHAAIDPHLKAEYPRLVAFNYRATPLMAGGRLFVQNGLGLAEALDPATGNVLWTQEPLAKGLEGLAGGPASRGVGYWR